jgi:hypothetical protein
MCGETEFFYRLYSRHRAFGDPCDLRNRERIVEAYLAIESVRRLGMDRAVLRERLLSEGVSWAALFTSMLNVYADSSAKPYFGEKTPRHALYVKTLCEWFPDCTIIHLVRDPRAVVYSLTQVPFASRSALVGATTWCVYNDAARAVSARGNYLLVKYEDLVTRTEEELHRVCDHIGLEFEEAMLQANPSGIDPRRLNRRAYETMTAARVSLWREEFEPWQVSAIETAAGPLMGEFGYLRQTKGAAAGMARATVEAVVEMTFQKLFRAPCILYHYLWPTNLAAQDKWLARASAAYGRVRSRPTARAGSHQA